MARAWFRIPVARSKSSLQILGFNLRLSILVDMSEKRERILWTLQSGKRGAAWQKKIISEIHLMQ